MKKLSCILALVLIALALLGTASAEAEGTVLFEGEKSEKFINFNTWKDIVNLNLSRKKIDISLFTSPFRIEVEYESEAAPVLFFMSWTGGASKAQIEADSAENGVATYTYSTIARAYGDQFDKLNAISLRANGAFTTIRKVTVIPVSNADQVCVQFEGKAGEWLASVNAGWNLGNTLESYGTWIGNHKKTSAYETAWGNPVTSPEIIAMIKEAGFDTIRVPVTWWQNMDDSNNYTVDEAWMNRVQEVVDMSLNAGLKVILNVHHDTGENGWLRADTSKMEQQLPKFIRLWEQIADRFRDYDDTLVFEGFNEILDSESHWNNPSDDACTAVNQLNQVFVDTVRKSGGNNAGRVLLLTTYAASNEEKALSSFVLPTDTAENSLIVEFHMYSPIQYCFPIPDGYTETSWEANNGRSEVRAIINRMYTYFTSKGIPVIMGEYSASAKRNESDRCEWTAYVRKTAAAEGIPCVWWDNGGRVTSADEYEQMGLLNRHELSWIYPDLVKAVTENLKAAEEEKPLPGGLSGKKSEDYEPIWQAAETKGFKLGICYSYNQMWDNTFLSFAARHFNSITPTNELKAYSLLNWQKTAARKDGMPGLDYTMADQMLAWAQKNGVQVRGHVLVWDAYMTDWFFRVDYSQSKPYADQETIRTRMAWYINEVITHCETQFPGVVYCWDVVNEAVGDTASEYAAGDARQLRTMRSGNPNLFRDLAGDDYVEYAFLCARNTVEALGADIRLFYNDYNAFQPQKRTAICALVNSINHYAFNEDGTARKLVDGVGMQGYVGGYGTQNGCMNDADIEAIRQSIHVYADQGMEVHITEMSLRNYSDKDADIAKHAAYCGKMFAMFSEINTEESAPLTCVALWGFADCNSLPADHYTYKLNGPYCGLVNEKYELKTAFDEVYNALSAN